ncbi:MAG: class I SAM-dependent methyltransferase, partial [Planctomycetales bacterium]|nr:class I SAM-dependent methyltransferase [Planctomycetales bacterium]
APRFEQLNREFEEATRDVHRKDIPFHRALAQRDLHPLLMSSPFMNRAFNKPLGYAGDYQMVSMMLGDPWQGNNTFAKIVNASALRHDAPAAHRNRIDLLQQALTEVSVRTLSTYEHHAPVPDGTNRGGMSADGENRRVKVLNIGCGPAEEILRFAHHESVSAFVDFRLIDFNAETLDYVRINLVPTLQRIRPELGIETEQRSVHEILKMSQEKGHESEFSTGFDLVYCAGLFDYFRDATCSFLLELFYTWINPGGTVLVSNVTPAHSSIAMMGMVLDWNLELRSRESLMSLVPRLGHQKSYVDQTGVNAFLEIRKPRE